MLFVGNGTSQEQLGQIDKFVYVRNNLNNIVITERKIENQENSGNTESAF